MTKVSGTYVVQGGAVTNFFDPGLLADTGLAVSVPTGYGNANSSNGITVQNWVEFGWQNTGVSPPGVISVNIAEVPTGYAITWTEALGYFDSRDRTATVTLSSDAFQACTSITRDSNTFPSTPSEELSGSTVTLVTEGYTVAAGSVLTATWSLGCTRVSPTSHKPTRCVAIGSPART